MLDVILPNYYPDFKPDLTIIGPNEGLQNQQIINKMIHSTITNNNISTIAFLLKMNIIFIIKMKTISILVQIYSSINET